MMCVVLCFCLVFYFPRSPRFFALTASPIWFPPSFSYNHGVNVGMYTVAASHSNVDIKYYTN